MTDWHLAHLLSQPFSLPSLSSALVSAGGAEHRGATDYHHSVLREELKIDQWSLIAQLLVFS